MSRDHERDRRERGLVMEEARTVTHREARAIGALGWSAGDRLDAWIAAGGTGETLSTFTIDHGAGGGTPADWERAGFVRVAWKLPDGGVASAYQRVRADGSVEVRGSQVERGGFATSFRRR